MGAGLSWKRTCVSGVYFLLTNRPPSYYNSLNRKKPLEQGLFLVSVNHHDSRTGKEKRTSGLGPINLCSFSKDNRGDQNAKNRNHDSINRDFRYRIIFEQ